MSGSVFVICEKANAARRISSILSGNRDKANKSGRVQYHTFTTDERDYAVVGLRGHIIDIDFPEEFKRWSRKRLKDMVWTDAEKIVTESGIASALKKIYGELSAKGDVEVVVATDFDREGELIGVEGIGVLDAPEDQVTRARFSALTAQEVKNAFSNIEKVDRNLAEAAESRREIDLLWGVILTRFLSLSTRRTGKDFLSAGRVQTPTLALINKRENEIKAFVPEPYWVIPANFEEDGVRFKAGHMAEPFRDEADANARFAKVEAASAGKVVEVSVTPKEVKPPAPFDTTAFLRAATGQGLQASRAMSVAEELYTQGLISYPRTDNTVYPGSLNLKGTAKIFEDSDHSKEAAYVLAGPMTPSRGKKTSTDHPPIHPVGVARRKDLQKDHWMVYDLVVRRFLGSLSPAARVETSESRIDVEHEPFIAKGYRTVDPGWRQVYPFFKSEESHVPKLTMGSEIKLTDINLLRKETKPPSRYSQGNIIQEMERLGLGTKSTRHEILSKLYSRGYIRGMSITPTATGGAVVDVLAKHASEITEAEMTAELESDMGEIADGKMTKDDVVKRSRELLDKVLDTLEEHSDEIGIGIRKVLLQENVIGKCECGGTLYTRQSKANKRFVGCSGYPECRNTYPLPQYGHIEPTGETCKSCGSPVIKVITKGRKPWITCIDMGCETKKKKE